MIEPLDGEVVLIAREGVSFFLHLPNMETRKADFSLQPHFREMPLTLSFL
jgi:hypothetical protein